MLKTISIISISIHHVTVSFWPYLTQKTSQNKVFQPTLYKIQQLSQNLMRKISIIYQNSMMGLMIGLSFFYLIPISNDQIKENAYGSQSINVKSFPFGTLTALLSFVFVLGNSNYFYHTNSTRNNPKIGNFRSRSQFEHQILSNKKLQIRRRLAVQDFHTQLMISLPSILLTSCLASTNNENIWFWCLVTVLFEKHHICSYFSRSYYASALLINQVKHLIFSHLAINIVYLVVGFFLSQLFPISNGILNGISSGIIIYDVMIQKLAKNYQQKDHLKQKILFFLSGILLSCLIITN